MNSLVVEAQEPRARDIAVGDDSLTVHFVDGRTLIVPLLWFPRLWHGTDAERKTFETSGEGAFIHWPELDEDLSVADLVAGLRSGETPESLRKWLDRRAAQSPSPPPAPSSARRT